eukprot:TRINITY_DN32366_c0_g1_i1.p2 TRINITY_DN32366_c0_g1~~TRINITY_DN32366_c0_g1_i1.p2  ORF type:complete len:162 (-),score=44.21 TRINITY_DN32366_c0_g1_i1:33-518(-)
MLCGGAPCCAVEEVAQVELVNAHSTLQDEPASDVLARAPPTAAKATVTAEPPPGAVAGAAGPAFEIELRRSGGQSKVGLDVRKEPNGLRIIKIKTGLVLDWNVFVTKQGPTATKPSIREGDLILAVNGVTPAAGDPTPMLDIMAESAIITLTLEPCPLPAA